MFDALDSGRNDTHAHRRHAGNGVTLRPARHWPTWATLGQTDPVASRVHCHCGRMGSDGTLLGLVLWAVSQLFGGVREEGGVDGAEREFSDAADLDLRLARGDPPRRGV